MSAKAAVALLVCSVAAAATVHGVSIQHFDGSSNDFSSPRDFLQHDTISGFENQDRATTNPVKSVSPLPSSQSVFRPAHSKTEKSVSPFPLSQSVFRPAHSKTEKSVSPLPSSQSMFRPAHSKTEKSVSPLPSSQSMFRLAHSITEKSVRPLKSSRSVFRPAHSKRHSIPSSLYPPLFIGRPLSSSSYPYWHVSRIPPASPCRTPFHYNRCHHGYLNAGAMTFGRPVYNPVTFYNNPVPYLVPWQPTIPSNAPHPSESYDDADEYAITGGYGSILDINPSTQECPSGYKKDSYNKCREDNSSPFSPSTNTVNCLPGFVEFPKGHCRKVADLYG